MGQYVRGWGFNQWGRGQASWGPHGMGYYPTGIPWVLTPQGKVITINTFVLIVNNMQGFGFIVLVL